MDQEQTSNLACTLFDLDLSDEESVLDETIQEIENRKLGFGPDQIDLFSQFEDYKQEKKAELETGKICWIY